MMMKREVRNEVKKTKELGGGFFYKKTKRRV